MDRKSQKDFAKEALRLKRAAERPERPESRPFSDVGPVMTPRKDHPPSGAFDAEGHRPVLERSRKVR